MEVEEKEEGEWRPMDAPANLLPEATASVGLTAGPALTESMPGPKWEAYKESSKYPVGPTETERCIESLLAVFQRYASKDGKATHLSKAEFLTFMNTELASFTKHQKDPGVLDRMMKKLDMNCDGQLDFGEFLNLIGGLAQACHVEVMKSPTAGVPPKP